MDDQNNFLDFTVFVVAQFLLLITFSRGGSDY